MIYETERTIVLIDGQSLHRAARMLNAEIDYKLFLAYFRERCRLVSCTHFTVTRSDDVEQSIRPLIDWLGYNGFRTVSKIGREITDAHGKSRLRGNIDIEIAVTALRLAPTVDHIVLATGNGDFAPLVAEIQFLGKRVSVLSTAATRPPVVSDDLRRQADVFLELDDLPVTRPARSIQAA